MKWEHDMNEIQDIYPTFRYLNPADIGEVKFEEYVNRKIDEEKTIVSIVLNGVIGDNRVIKTAKAAQKLGYKPIIIGTSPDIDYKYTESLGVEIVLIPNQAIELKLKKQLYDKNNNRNMDLFVNNCAKIIYPLVKKINPDLLHTHDMYSLHVGGYIMSSLSKDGKIIPWIHDVHEYVEGLTSIADNYRNLALSYQGKFLRQPDSLITVSEKLADILENDYILSKKPIITYNTPYRSDFDEEYQDIRSAINLPFGQKLVAYVGRLTYERGASIIIDAIRGLSDVHVCFVSGQTKGIVEDIKEKAQSYGIQDRVHFHPYVDGDKVSSFLRTADLGIHPMTHFPNGEVAMPNKLFEYLHAKIPVVVSDVEELKRFVDTFNVGEVFEANSSKSCSEAIQKIISRKDFYKNNINDNLLSKFCWENQERKIVKIYENLLVRYSDAKNNVDIKNKNFSDIWIMHGVTVSAGQPHAVSTALSKIGCKSESVRIFSSKSGLSYTTDRVFEFEKNNEVPFIFSRIARMYDVFHFYSRSFFLDLPSRAWPTFQDILALRAADKRIVMNFRGSEVRLESKFREISPFHWCDELPELRKSFPEEVQKRFIEAARGICHKMVVLDPEMRTYVPDAEVIPRAIDLDKWDYVGPVNRDRPLIVHAPTNNKIKGTDYVLSAIEKLENEGLDFEFRIIQGESNENVKKEFMNADIVVDQLRVGWYGVVSVEAMALGKCAVCYISDKLLPEFYPSGPPLAVADPNTIEDVLRQLIRDPKSREYYGKMGRQYCESTHDSKKVARQYADLYKDIIQDPNQFDFNAFGNMFLYQDSIIKEHAKKRNLYDKSLKAVKSKVAGKAAPAKKVAPPSMSIAKKKALFDPPYNKIPARIVRRIIRRPIS